MIKEMHGDLLELFKAEEFNAIIHGCNCYHTMGAGIAGQIADQFPQAYKADLLSPTGDMKLGDYTACLVFNEKTGQMQHILNAYTQRHPGKEDPSVLYPAIEKALSRIKTDLSADIPIGLPLIGCGIAGGDWAIVKSIIEKVFDDRVVTVVHYQPSYMKG